MLLACLLLAMTTGRSFGEERLLLDRRLETLRRILPDAASPSADAAHAVELLRSAGLGGLQVTPRGPLEAGERGDVVLDVVAVGRFADAERFFRLASLSPRLIDVEALTLTASPNRLLRVTAVLRLPFRPTRAPVAAPPEGFEALLRGVPRAQRDLFLRDVALSAAKSQAIAGLRRARRNPRLFLAELAAAVRERPVALDHASLTGDEFSVRGFSVGEGALRVLERRLERGFFRLADFQLAREGACHHFEARGRSPIVGPEAELPLPAEDPFQREEAPCRPDRDPVEPVTVKTSAKPAAGAFTVRLRDLDLADAFQVLGASSGRGYLVDGDVRGRVTLDASAVSLAELQGMLERQFGLHLVESASFVRVARGSRATAPTPAPDSPRLSLAGKRGELRDVLASLAEADPGLRSLGPAGPLGRVSAWLRDAPAAELFAALVEGAGLQAREEDGQRVLMGPSDTASPQPIASEGPERRMVVRAEDVTAQELVPVAIAANGDTWVAFSYSPTGGLITHRAGDRLADATVRSISATDVVLDTEEGPLTAPLAVAR
jgi:hypothetical protein